MTSVLHYMIYLNTSMMVILKKKSNLIIGVIKVHFMAKLVDYITDKVIADFPTTVPDS